LVCHKPLVATPQGDGQIRNLRASFGQKNQQRGTSHRMDNIDQALRLKARGDEGFTVHFEKKREFGGIEAAPVEIHIEFDNDKILFTRQESDKTEQKDRNLEIWKMHQAGKQQKDIAEGFGISPGRVSQIVEKMKQNENRKTKHK